MSRRVSVDGMADAIMEELTKYSELAADELKAAVKETAQSVRKDIQASAPSRTGKYKKSWSVKTMKESSETIDLVVHSKKTLSDSAPSGTRPRQARRRKGGGKTAYRSRRTGRKRKAGQDHRAKTEGVTWGPRQAVRLVGERTSNGMNELFALCAETNDMEFARTI